MKKQLCAFLILGSILFNSCSEDEGTPLNADFDVTVTGESPAAVLTFMNKSTGAESYLWEFGDGADEETSSVKDPSGVVVEKAGEFTVKLTVKRGTETKEVSKSVAISGHSAINVFTDIEFATLNGLDEFPRFFSTETGLSYKDGEVKGSEGASIDIAFVYVASSLMLFDAPNSTDRGFNIPNATETKFENYVVADEYTIEQFDAMTNDSDLKALTIEGDNDSFPASSLPVVVLFENAAGKRGVIKVKSINIDRILTDIKVQKY